MKLLNPEDKNISIEVARTEEQWKYMFNAKNGKLSLVDERMFCDYDTDWYYISEEVYPVYENNVYIGYYESQEFRGKELLTITKTLDLTTHNPACLHYDTYLGICGHPEGHLMACRDGICPNKNKLTDEQLKKLFKEE